MEDQIIPVLILMISYTLGCIICAASYQRRHFMTSRLWIIIVQIVPLIYGEDFNEDIGQPGAFERVVRVFIATVFMLSGSAVSFWYSLKKGDIVFAVKRAVLVFRLARDALIRLSIVRDDLLTGRASCVRMIIHMALAAHVCVSFAYWTTPQVSGGLLGFDEILVFLAHFVTITAIMAAVAA